ncbi:MULTISPECIES: M56 family metallopeptidase [Micromonospora]|uniref:M56 family peptidase n=1 Tax=Micromonospora solifontis TaxID=2487138 RepID=A0ABX9WL83_9ACTN|nr:MULTISPECIES: M56 family metallopeptidase [Micromonospora]NES14397.1 M56 family metallopeptidase [Micromonospora sp. PPF5-17B]NES34995.1 M56 family metallopeptidase [Micromonospora solifontis]NES57504.1 M56 family metallopeptidase [Micromonospora sp. PPF5-6]RNM01267.1 M56 family peptidase [Micromonospora solifontis]
MAYAVHFAATILACWLTAQVLTVSKWTWRAPRVAILCWQAVGLALGLSAMGLPMAVGLAAYDRPTGSALLALAEDLAHGTLPAGVGAAHLGLVGIGFGIGAVLLTTTVRSIHGTVRAQRRHRELLSLVARRDPTVPGALVLDHPSAAAYCLPGVRPRVVVSAGTLSLLDRAELAAVLTHERTHAQERHDLVLLPFTALCRALPWFGWVRDAHEQVALLVEMRADDKARELHAEAPLAGALRRFAAAGHRVTPAGALGVGDRDLDVRVQRLLVADRPPRLLGGTALAVATTLVALPISLFLS